MKNNTIVEHKYPKPRYKAHYGGPQPIDNNARVEIVFRSGHCSGPHLANVFYWIHEGAHGDIIAYRVLENDE